MLRLFRLELRHLSRRLRLALRGKRRRDRLRLGRLATKLALGFLGALELISQLAPKAVAHISSLLAMLGSQSQGERRLGRRRGAAHHVRRERRCGRALRSCLRRLPLC